MTAPTETLFLRGNSDVAAIQVTTTGRLFTIEGVVSDVMASVLYDPDFRLNWEFSLDGQSWEAAGMTETPVYIGYKTPNAAATFWRTVVHIGVTNAAGTTWEGDRHVTDSIYGEFTDKSVTRWNGGNALTYWGAAAPMSGDPRPVGVGTLLATGDAKCGCWAGFFQEILGSQGVSANVIEVTPLNGAILAVNDVAFNGPAQPFAGFPSEFGWLESSNAALTPGAAQGGIPSRGHFSNHAIVRVNIPEGPNGAFVTKFYDPSYGTQPFGTEEDWENASIAAIGGYRPADRIHLLLRKPTTGHDTVFTVFPTP